MDESFEFPPELAEKLAHLAPGALDFAPVPVKSRRDGWTAGSQKLFIAGLAAGLGVSGAVRLVGMSRQTAYRLRERPGAAGFAAAWDRALGFSRRAGKATGLTAWQRAIEGVLVPLRGSGGRILGWRRKYCNRTLAAMLAARWSLEDAPR
jgi:hypothetical protein